MLVCCIFLCVNSLSNLGVVLVGLILIENLNFLVRLNVLKIVFSRWFISVGFKSVGVLFFKCSCVICNCLEGIFEMVFILVIRFLI